jgi:hypothetical protein
MLRIPKNNQGELQKKGMLKKNQEAQENDQGFILEAPLALHLSLLSP